MSVYAAMSTAGGGGICEMYIGILELLIYSFITAMHMSMQVGGVETVSGLPGCLLHLCTSHAGLLDLHIPGRSELARA